MELRRRPSACISRRMLAFITLGSGLIMFQKSGRRIATANSYYVSLPKEKADTHLAFFALHVALSNYRVPFGVGAGAGRGLILVCRTVFSLYPTEE